MKISIKMIRHGMTAGNMEQRYVGTTDESLCEEGRLQLMKKKTDISGEWMPETVYVSPMRRCRETAEILFPSARQRVVEGFRECSFGEFEYKNYLDLNGNPDYQAWIDSGGTIGFPGGENQMTFCLRVWKAFERWLSDTVIPIAQAAKEEEVVTAMVAHGGTIMAILSKWAVPHQEYFCWQVKNGSGYAVWPDTDEWQNGHQHLMMTETI